MGKQGEKSMAEKETADKPKQPFYKKAWFWVIVVIVVICIGAAGASSNKESENNGGNSSSEQESSGNKVTLIDFNGKTEAEILTWCKENKLDCYIEREYSDTVAKDKYIKQSIASGESTKEGTKVTATFSLGKAPTSEQKNALKQAESYAKNMHMSKQRVYDQLVSEYGGGFAAADAQYAMDHLEGVDWSENALVTAKSYYNNMHMSKNKVYDQLVSEYGEKFTAEEAQYAVDHLTD